MIITNCWVTGTITGGVESGAICGYSGSGSVVKNCWSTCQMPSSSIYSSDSFTRGSAQVITRQNSHCRKHHRAPLRTLCDSFLPVRWRLDLFVCSRSCPPKPLHGPLVIAHHCFLNTSRVAPLFMGFLPSSMGFPDSSKGKESACNAGDPGFDP